MRFVNVPYQITKHTEILAISFYMYYAFFSVFAGISSIFQQVPLAAGEPHSSNCQHLINARECLILAIIAKRNI